MIVRTDIPNLLRAGMKREFFKVYDGKILPEFQRIAMITDSDGDLETYPWLGGIAQMREWKDERIPKNLLEHHFEVVNKTFEGSIAVDRDEIDDEKYGQTKIKIGQLADEAKRFMGSLIFTLVNQGNLSTGTGVFNGVNINCYDGNPYFSALHTEGLSGTQSNIGALALNRTNLQTAISTMMTLNDDQGTPVNVQPDLLVIHPNQQWLARELLESTYFPEGATEGAAVGAKVANNVLKGALGLYITPYITAGRWFVFDTTRIVKPLLLQMRRKIAFDSVTAGYEQFMRKKLFFGCDWRGQAAFAMWQYAYGSFPV